MVWWLLFQCIWLLCFVGRVPALTTTVSFVPILSIEAYRAHYQLHNVKPAIHLDASLPHQYWGGIQPESLDLVVNINMIHISPFACTEVGPALLRLTAVLISNQMTHCTLSLSWGDSEIYLLHHNAAKFSLCTSNVLFVLQMLEPLM